MSGHTYSIFVDQPILKHLYPCFYFSFEVLGDDSDHGPFVYRIGVPSFSPYFTYNKQVSGNVQSNK